MPELTRRSPVSDQGPPPRPRPLPNPNLCNAELSTGVKKIDEAIVRNSKEEVDTLLVVVSVHFAIISERTNSRSQAGLFSAVQGAFIIESYKQLQSDPADVTVQLLLHISQQLSNSSVAAVPELPSFAPSSSSIRLNVLWFSGLVISLITASFSIFAK